MQRALLALERLRAGNRRFVADTRDHDAGTGPARRHELAAGQEPFAILLGCSDSRVQKAFYFIGRWISARQATPVFQGYFGFYA